MNHVGFLMVRNEADVLAESLAHHAAFFDTIVAQDGSTDGGTEIIRACPQVVKLFRDEDVLRPGERWTDGHRQHALSWILEEFGPDTWVTLLHADEFFRDSPLWAAERAHKCEATYAVWGEFRFFLHPSDARNASAFRWNIRRRFCRSVRARVTHWAGPFFEVRQFGLMTHQVYIRGRDHCTLPSGPGAPACFSIIPRYCHYPYRSPAQCRAAYQDKVATRYWQPDHAWLAAGNPHIAALPQPRNSPLAAWRNTGRYDWTDRFPDLPDPKTFLPAWWKG